MLQTTWVFGTLQGARSTPGPTHSRVLNTKTTIDLWAGDPPSLSPVSSPRVGALPVRNSFYDLVGAAEHGKRNRQAERLCGLGIHD